MKVFRRRGLVVLAGLALAVALVDTLGWWWWRGATRVLAINPEAGARILAETPFFKNLSVIDRSRKLPVDDLGEAPIDLAFAALLRFGVQQYGWMPAHPSGPTHLASAYLLAGDLNAAVPFLDEAVKRHPTSAALKRLQALIQMSRGEVDTALESLALAMALAPDLVRPELELPPESQRTVRLRSLELRGELYPMRRTEATLALARELRRGGDLGAARAILEEVDNHPEVVLERASWAVNDGDGATAIALLEELTDRRSVPRRVRARAWSIMALALDLGGDRDGALAAANRALSLDPNSAHAFISLAGLAEGRGDYDGALEHLRRAWGMAPSDVGLLLRIARVAERADKQPEALFALERAVKIDPSSPQLAVQMVSLQLRMGKYSEAALALSRALDRHPTDPALLDLADRLRRDVGIR